MFSEIENGNREESIVQQYNEAATKQFNEEVLERCEGCGRTFNPEALVKHQKHCLQLNGISPQSNKSESEQYWDPELEPPKPKLLVCYICGREFGSTSLEIHLKTCKQKWEWAQEQKPAH